MFKVSIKKDAIETNAGTFETQELAQAWVLENHDYFPEGYSEVTTDITLELQVKAEKAEALELLKSTDWYVIRFMETQVAIPSEISTLRAAARSKVIN